MKKSLFVFSIVFMMISQIGLAQHKGAHAITYKFIGVDTYSPYAKLNTDGTRQFKFAGKDAIDNMSPGVEISYYYGLKDWLAVGVPFRLGKIDIRENALNNNFSDELFYSFDARAKLSAFFKDKQIIVPYLSTGLGMMKREDSKADMQLPVELGLNLRIAQNFYVSVGTEYRFSFDELGDGDVQSFTNNMMHSAGFTFVLGDVKEETPPPPPPPVEVEVEAPPADADGDGIVDAEDTCPDVAGLAKFAGCPDTDGDDIQDSADDCPDVAGLAAFKGCPDSDGDGLPDNSDDCPTEAGSLSNKGCPIKVLDRDNDGVADDADACPDTPGKAAMGGCPDTDGDGIADKKDQCPSVPGIAKFNGCPDTDGDGVADKSDKCPTTKGTVANNGCPEIKKEDVKALTFATEGVEFETGKNIIRTSSYPSLDNVASIMAKYPNYNLSISGYTDSVGNDANNQKLSERRARACFDYLVGKGVSPSRMSSVGYGEANPIADNSTKEGRQRNRRVEFNIFLK